MGNAPSSATTGASGGRGGSSSSSDSDSPYSFNNADRSDVRNAEGASAYVRFVDSSAVPEATNAAATNGSENRAAAAASAAAAAVMSSPISERPGRRLFRIGPISAGSSSSSSSSSSRRQLPPAETDSMMVLDDDVDDRPSSAISVGSTNTSSTATSASTSTTTSSTSSSSSSTSHMDSDSTASDSGSSAVGSPVAVTGSGLGGYLRSRFPGSFSSGRGRRGYTFASRRAMTGPAAGADEHPNPGQPIFSWAEGEGARVAALAEGETREGFPRGVSSDLAAAAATAANSGGVITPGGRLRAAFGLGSLSRSRGAHSFFQTSLERGGGDRLTRPPVAVMGRRQTLCPRCGALLLIPPGSGTVSLRCSCGAQLSRMEAFSSMAPTDANRLVPAPAMPSSSSSSSSSSSLSSSDDNQDETARRDRDRRRAHRIRLREALQLSQPSPASDPSALSPMARARARVRARVRARTRATSWTPSTQRSTLGNTGAERRQSQEPEEVEAIDGGGSGVEGETPEESSTPSAAAGAGSGARAAAGNIMTPFASFPRSRSSTASGESSVGEAVGIRWASAADGTGASGASTSVRTVGRGGVNHLQVVMCSNCGRAGVIQSAEVVTSRMMFFCSCGNPVFPATPAQLLAALSRGTAGGGVRPRGASQQLINLLPTMVFKEDSQWTETAELGKGLSEGDDKVSCRICLCDYEEGNSLRILPCLHKFHQPCIDEWLGRSPLCPLCNTSVDVVYTDPMFAGDSQSTPPPT